MSSNKIIIFRIKMCHQIKFFENIYMGKITRRGNVEYQRVICECVVARKCHACIAHCNKAIFDILSRSFAAWQSDIEAYPKMIRS